LIIFLFEAVPAAAAACCRESMRVGSSFFLFDAFATRFVPFFPARLNQPQRPRSNEYNPLKHNKRGNPTPWGSDCVAVAWFIAWQDGSGVVRDPSASTDSLVGRGETACA
jgi:hypothetical protein